MYNSALYTGRKARDITLHHWPGGNCAHFFNGARKYSKSSNRKRHSIIFLTWKELLPLPTVVIWKIMSFRDQSNGAIKYILQNVMGGRNQRHNILPPTWEEVRPLVKCVCCFNLLKFFDFLRGGIRKRCVPHNSTPNLKLN